MDEHWISSIPERWRDCVFRPLAEYDADTSRHWALPSGATLEPQDNLLHFEVAGGAQAVWSRQPFASGQIDLRCRLIAGSAIVSLRVSTEPSQCAYAVQIAENGIVFSRRVGDGVRVLGSFAHEVEPGQWHDLTVAMHGSRVTVWFNGRRALTVIDTDPLPPGALAFGGFDGSVIELADLLVWASLPWADSDATDIRDLIAARTRDFARFIRSLDTGPLFFGPPAPLPGVPIQFQKAVEAGINQPTVHMLSAEISSGLIPPNFIHSWAIDLRDIQSFAFDWGSHDPRQSLDLGGGDRLYVVDAANQKLKEFKTTDHDWLVSLPATGATAYDTPPLRRIYLVLEASAKAASRRLTARGVIDFTPLAQSTGAEAALLVEDDLNYDSSLGPLFWATDAQGTRIPVGAPWGLPESIHHYRVSLPAPNDKAGPAPADGWYLVGKNITEYAEAKTGYFSLVYYNERLGKVRIYLWNLNVTDATAYWVTVALQKRTAQGFEDLDGALFINDPRPTRWSKAMTIVPAWPQSKWSFVEIPMLLYPMATSLSGTLSTGQSPGECRRWTTKELQQQMEKAGVPTAQAEELIRRFRMRGMDSGWATLVAVLVSSQVTDTSWMPQLLEVHKPECYRSVYEERIEPEGGLCNFRLRIGIRPLDVGKAELDFIGKATGQGVQISAASTVSLAEQAFDAFSKAGDWYGKGESLHKKIVELLDDQKKSGASAATLGLLGSLAAMGSSGWGAILAAVAIWVSIFKELFSDDPEPLRMAIELAIWGKVSGIVATEKQERNAFVYLPGRFSFPAAFKDGKIHTRYMNNMLPRYDRTLGLFGFRYDPSTLRLPIGQRWYVSGDSPWAECVFPAEPYDGAANIETAAAPLERHLTRSIDRWLPVIFNPYAEIVPVKPHLRAPASALENALGRFKWEFGDTAPFPDFLMPEFTYPALKGEMVFSHEPWFDWVQDMSPKSHVAREPGDHSFPTKEDFKTGSSAYILAYSPVASAALGYSIFHVSPLTDMDGAKLPRHIGQKNWGTPATEKRDVRKGIWLAVPPVSFVPGVYLPVVVSESIGQHHYGFGQQTAVAPQPLEDFADTTQMSVQHGWRMRFQHTADDGLPWKFDDETRPFPLQDVLFCWDIKYFYYGRSRQQQLGVPLSEHTAEFRVPVDIHVVWKFKSYWNSDDRVPETDMAWNEVLYRSQMLQEPS